MAYPTAAGCDSGEKWLLCLPASSTKSTNDKARKEEKVIYDIHRRVQECVFHKNLILQEIWLMCRNINQESATSLAAVCANSLSLLFLAWQADQICPELAAGPTAKMWLVTVLHFRHRPVGYVCVCVSQALPRAFEQDTCSRTCSPAQRAERCLGHHSRVTAV